LPAGQHQVRMEFAYAGGGLGKGGKVTLYTDGKQAGQGEIGATLPIIFSADDGCDLHTRAEIDYPTVLALPFDPAR